MFICTRGGKGKKKCLLSALAIFQGGEEFQKQFLMKSMFSFQLFKNKDCVDCLFSWLSENVNIELSVVLFFFSVELMAMQSLTKTLNI